MSFETVLDLATKVQTTKRSEDMFALYHAMNAANGIRYVYTEQQFKNVLEVATKLQHLEQTGEWQMSSEEDLARLANTATADVAFH